MAVTPQKDLVHETSTTTGTGNFTTAAVNGKQRFSDAGAFGTGATTNVFDYFISNRDVAGEFEIGTGHMSAAGTLVRDTAINGSAGISTLVTFTAGTKDVTNDIPATLQVRASQLRGYLAGLILSNNVATPNTKIDVTAGVARDDTNGFTILATAVTLNCATTGANGLDTGTLAASTWYHAFAIAKADGTAASFASTSTGPTLPSGYVYKRRIGSFKTDGLSAILAFVQDGETFRWALPVSDVVVVNPGTSAVTRTLTVPTGIRVQADIVVLCEENFASGGAPGGVYISDLSLPDLAASGSIFTFYNFQNTSNDFVIGGPCSAMTNTSGQVRSRAQLSNAGFGLNISTLGWRDSRGKDA